MAIFGCDDLFNTINIRLCRLSKQFESGHYFRFTIPTVKQVGGDRHIGGVHRGVNRHHINNDTHLIIDRALKIVLTL